MIVIMIIAVLLINRVKKFYYFSILLLHVQQYSTYCTGNTYGSSYLLIFSPCAYRAQRLYFYLIPRYSCTIYSDLHFIWISLSPSLCLSLSSCPSLSLFLSLSLSFFYLGGESFVEFGMCPRDASFPNNDVEMKVLSYAKLNSLDRIGCHGIE